MENKDNDIKLENITEAGLDGVKKFIIAQLDELVLPYIYKNDLMFSNDKNSIYQEYLNINSSLNNLFIVYSDESIDLSNKKIIVNDMIVELYTRTKNLIIKVSLGEKKTNNNDDNQLKIR